ncbi:hypothetical protein [Actinoplanes couchii]|uniref:Uncharacterized protein n=1 Tax=Actinoplanes couchii TaxID=403638 RepID=A0ABQ3XRD6_9ACTN|nr:hypothetical protein [Actinoplanes couchii]MDR6320015.1 hypothetical protein [Actinoplanes couchii]GID61054.1 hypothetical protein Aco03nite_094580 [Actinoplanes couchii]
MAIAWRDSPEALVEILRRRGLDPDRVDNVEAAWAAFGEFLREPIDGLEPDPDSDADGFIVQWGRYGWHDRLPSLSFTRQYAVNMRATWTEPDWYQPEHWHVNLTLVFPDAPALADLGQLNVQDTGFDFSPPGAERDHAIREAEWEMNHYPTLRALWKSVPSSSAVTLDQAG